VNKSHTAHLRTVAETLEARFAHRVAARLSAGAEDVGADIAERLRFAREQALARARAVRTAEAPVVVGAGSAGVGLLGGGGGWWIKLASVLPLLALAGGLVLIQHLHDAAQISAAAQIDAELLADDLPPAAYGDAGFAEFLKTPRD